MRQLRFSVVILLCIAIALPTEAGFFKSIGNAFKKAGEGIADVAKIVAKPLCQGYVKVGCPVTAAVGGGAAIALTGGSAAPVAVPGAIALATTCGVVAATNQCDKIGRRKRSGQIEEDKDGQIEVKDGMVYYPISDDFDEFDDNQDGLIEYEEFAFDFLARWKLSNPQQLRVIFKDADTDDDGFLDAREFASAPWDFGSYETKVQKTPVNGPAYETAE